MERLKLDKVKLMAAAATLAMFAGTACAHFEIYGNVNKEFLYSYDGFQSASIFADNNYDPSKLGVIVTKHLDRCTTFGAETELQFNPNNSRLVSQLENTSPYTSLVFIRKADAWMSHSMWGKLSLGLGYAASYGITDYSFAGTNDTSLGVVVANTAGGMYIPVSGSKATFADPTIDRVFNSLNGVGDIDDYTGLYTTKNRVRLDTGNWCGFSAAVSYGNVGHRLANYESIDDSIGNTEQYFDAAVRYTEDFCDFKVGAGVAFAHFTRDGLDSEIDPIVPGASRGEESWSGSIAAEHKPTGINAAVAGGVKRKINSSLDDYKMWYVQLGKHFCLTHYGQTNVALDYFHGKNSRLNGDKAQSYSLGITQDLNKINSAVYASVRNYKYDDVPGVNYHEVVAATVGVKINFGASL